MASFREVFVLNKRKNIVDVISLYLVALVNLVIPLFFMPYISKSIGLAKFGEFAVYASVIQYLIILIDFGATTPLVNHLVKSENINKASEILFSVIGFRLFVTLFVALISIFVFFYFSLEIGIYIAIVLILFGVAVNPYPLFQAHSLLPKFALINVVWRVVFSLWIYCSLNEDSSISMIIWFQFMPIAFASVSALIYLKWKGLMVLRPCSFNIKRHDLLFSESMSFLTGSFFSSGYTISLPIIIQIFFGSTATGVYGLLDRIVQPVKQIFNPLINVIYPKVCVAFSESFKKGMQMSCKGGIFIGAIALAGLLVGWLFSGYISVLLFNSIEYKSYITLISINMFFVYLSQVAVFLFITPMGASRFLKYIYFVLFLLFILCCLASVYMNKLIYIYWTLAMIELCGFTLLLLIIRNSIKR